MALSDVLRALRKHWWVVLVATVLGVLLSGALAFNATPIYQGSVTFFATTTATDSGSPLQGDQFGQQRVNSYVKLLGSQRLAERVEDSTDVDLSVEELMRAVEGKADLNTVLLTATVRDPSPEQVGEIAEAIAEQFPMMVDQIESQGGTTKAPVRLEVVSGPRVGDFPVSPMKKLWVGVGFLLGLTVGVIVAILLALLDRSVRTPDQLRATTSAPVLGRIPVMSPGRRGTGGAVDPQWAQDEAFRQLRTNLQFVDIARPVKVIVVTSSVAGEGKSTTSAKLAHAFAEAGRSVLLIDADLRRPTLAGLFRLEGAVGLTNVLAGQVSLEEIVQPWGNRRMDVLASGPIPPNPSELLGSEQMVHLLQEARASYDMVIVDTAPLLPVTDGAILSAHADGAVVVVRFGKTHVAEVLRAVESVRAVDARLLGTVLNWLPPKGLEGHNYDGYGYHSRRGDGEVAKSRRRSPRGKSSPGSPTPQR